jgi:hypothetical protein
MKAASWIMPYGGIDLEVIATLSERLACAIPS